MKYMIGTDINPAMKTDVQLVYIDFGGTIKQYSSMKDDDQWFNSWYEKLKADNEPKEFLKMERVAAFADTYEIEEGEYSGAGKEKVDKLLKKFGYDAP